MEWDQIADSWAAMTHRLRSDGTGRPRNIGELPDVSRAVTGADGKASDKMRPDVVGNDHSLPSRR